MGDLLLGIDVGTTAVKAAIVDTRGNLLAACQAEYPIFHVRSTWVEQNPEDWWQATCQVVRQSLSGVSHAPERILSLAVSSQGPTLLPLDRSGKPLGRAMIWMDRRAAAEAQWLSDIIGADEIYQVTGNRPDPYFIASRLLWMKNHEPEQLARACLFVQVNGYINHRLTGCWTLDHVQAALLQLRDYSTGEWSPTLCNACGVNPSQFPDVFPGDQVQGEVTSRAAEETGLRRGTPVMVGTVDSCAAALEAGVIEPGVAVEMSGTSTVFMLPNNRGLTEPRLIAQPHVVSGTQFLFGAMVSSGASLRWFRDQLGNTDISGLNADSFDSLTEQAGQVSVGSDGVIFLPYMMGERSPLWNTNARGAFIGLSLTTRRKAMVRAILEGVSFALRHNMDVAISAGAEIREVRCVGGCSRSDVWNQIKADVLGRPFLLPRHPIGAAFGDAILAGVGAGVFVDIRKCLREMVQIERRFEPNQSNHERYMSIYSLFLKLYQDLKEDFDLLAEFTQISAGSQASVTEPSSLSPRRCQ